jgi:hypothetical protein
VYVKAWNADGNSIREEVRAARNADDAADAFDRYDPRKKSLELSDRREVTVSASHATAGSPDASQIHCGSALDRRQDTRDCEFWVWWARYGQYTIYLDVTPQGESDTAVEKRDFLRIVDIAAGYIGETLGEPR